MNAFVRCFAVRSGVLACVVLLTPLPRLLHRRGGQPCPGSGRGHWLELLPAAEVLQ